MGIKCSKFSNYAAMHIILMFSICLFCLNRQMWNDRCEQFCDACLILYYIQTKEPKIQQHGCMPTSKRKKEEKAKCIFKRCSIVSWIREKKRAQGRLLQLIPFVSSCFDKMQQNFVIAYINISTHYAALVAHRCVNPSSPTIWHFPNSRSWHY